jgi:RNA polymerase-binding transcription factor DksA
MKKIDKKILAELKSILETEKKTLTDELSQIGIQNPITGDWSAIPTQTDGDAESDYTDQADYIEDFESRSGRLNELEHRYQDIVTALDKMENNTYGICEKSGELIETDRLVANPAAKTCKAMMNL